MVGLVVAASSVDATKGALTQIYAAGSEQIEKQNVKGQYFVPYCKIADPTPIAQNKELAKQTWEWTEKILGREFKV